MSLSTDGTLTPTYVLTAELKSDGGGQLVMTKNEGGGLSATLEPYLITIGGETANPHLSTADW